MINSTAYFLVIHGSSRAFSFIQTLTSLGQQHSDSLFSGGMLEGSASSLSAQLQEFGKTADLLGYSHILVIPIFLLAGVHVKEDIPYEVEDAQKYFSGLSFKIADYFGVYPQITKILSQKFNDQKSDARVLIAHGSSRIGVSQEIENLASELQAKAAYWSTSPSLEAQIECLIAEGKTSITVLPYFLSSGGITEAIATKIMARNYKVNINILPLPFSPTEIAEILLKQINADYYC